MSRPHPVIAISGIPGAGKSRAALGLARRLGATYLPFDDFETLTQRDAAHALDWLSRDAPWAEMYDPALDGILTALAVQGPVVFETPLGRIPPNHSAVITCAIWIDVDLDIALARQLTKALAPGEWASPTEMSDWLGPFLENYQGVVRPCLAKQAEQVRPLSDHILDGTLSSSAVDAAIDRIVGCLTPPRSELTPPSAMAMERR